MKRILVICPLDRDRRELGMFTDSYEIIFHDFQTMRELGVQRQFSNQDVLALIDDIGNYIVRERIDGVMSTSDDLGTLLVALIAQRNDMAAPDPAVIIRQQHKAHARHTHKEFVPEATPQFALLDNGSECVLPFPFFVKPVRSNFSRGSQAVHTQEELLHAFQEASECAQVHPWFYIAQEYLPLITNGVLAEELCQGIQCTVEGFVYHKKITLIGIVDSIMFPGTISFQRFDYPSILPAYVQERMWEIISTLMRGIGFDNGCFNVECMYNPETDRITIIEVNPRLASQFADLYEKVDGSNSYEILLSIASGSEPRIKNKQGEFNAACSAVLRVFNDARIVKMPSDAMLNEIYAQYPAIRIELFGKPGQKLSEVMQDGKSFRYGLIHVGGENSADIALKIANIEAMLGIELRTA